MSSSRFQRVQREALTENFGILFSDRFTRFNESRECVKQDEPHGKSERSTLGANLGQLSSVKSH